MMAVRRWLASCEFGDLVDVTELCVDAEKTISAGLEARATTKEGGAFFGPERLNTDDYATALPGGVAERLLAGAIRGAAAGASGRKPGGRGQGRRECARTAGEARRAFVCAEVGAGSGSAGAVSARRDGQRAA